MNLLHGDCLELMPSIPDGSIDAIICDPPYGTTACKWDSVIPFAPMWEQLHRIIKPNGAIVLTSSQPFTSALIMSNIKMFRYEWVWNKANPSNYLNCKIEPMKSHENIVVFCNGVPNYFPIMSHGKMREKHPVQKKPDRESAYGRVKTGKSNINDLYYPKSIVNISNANQTGKVHPTQKPVALMEYLIKTYTNEGETVLDFTMGSGSTGVACVRTNRDFIGIEMDDKYYEIAQERIQAEIDRPKQLDLML